VHQQLTLLYGDQVTEEQGSHLTKCRPTTANPSTSGPKSRTTENQAGTHTAVCFLVSVV